MAYILILYYSKKGSIAEMTQWIAQGAQTVSNIEVRVRTVKTLSEGNQNQFHTASNIPYATLDDVRHCSGMILGSPAYFGNMAASLKHFIDQLTPLWMEGALIDKPAAVFSSSSSLHGGQESTLISMMIPLLHQGAILVSIPYSEVTLSTTHAGGTPYGATHFSGQFHERHLDQEEKSLCQALGKRVATLSLNCHNLKVSNTE